MDSELTTLLNRVIRDPLSPGFCHFCLRVWQTCSPRGYTVFCFFVHVQWERESEPFSQPSPLLLSDWLHTYDWSNSNHQSMPGTDEIDQNLCVVGITSPRNMWSSRGGVDFKEDVGVSVSWGKCIHAVWAAVTFCWI